MYIKKKSHHCPWNLVFRETFQNPRYQFLPLVNKSSRISYTNPVAVGVNHKKEDFVSKNISEVVKGLGRRRI